MTLKPMFRPVPAKTSGWPPPPANYEFIAVDFDGTLFRTEWPEIKEPRRDIIDWVIRERRRGAKIILHTCREYERLEAAIEACRAEGLEFDAVNQNPWTEFPITEQSFKPFADIYIDDKAWRV